MKGQHQTPAHTPCNWYEHQYAGEAWLEEAVQVHAVSSRGSVGPRVYLLTNHSLSLWCHRETATTAVEDPLSFARPEARRAGRACAQDDTSAPPTQTTARESPAWAKWMQ